MPHFEALLMVVGWTPDQCEDIYTVLILPDTIIHVEIDRTDEQDLPIIEFHKEERRLEDAFIDMLGKLEDAEAAALAGTIAPSPALPETPTAAAP